MLPSYRGWTRIILYFDRRFVTDEAPPIKTISFPTATNEANQKAPKLFS